MPKARVTIYLKEGILDPQGQAVNNVLKSLDIAKVEDVRVGKTVTLSFAPDCNEDEAARHTREICSKILANPVIEDYEFEIVPD